MGSGLRWGETEFLQVAKSWGLDQKKCVRHDRNGVTLHDWMWSVSVALGRRHEVIEVTRSHFRRDLMSQSKLRQPKNFIPPESGDDQ